MSTEQSKRVVATERDETDSCEAGTPGCCIDHTHSSFDIDCDTW